MFDFDTAYPAFRDEIRRLSYTQWIPDMDPDDIRSEMLIALWKACEGFDPSKGSLGGYWWNLWTNRRRDLTRAYAALKRVHAIPTDELPDVPHIPHKINVPPEPDPLGSVVWQEISDGATPAEIRESVGITRRSYYRLIHGWRSDRVRVHIADT